MAISCVVMVGESTEWIPEIVEKSKNLSVGPGVDNADIAPLITKASKDRVTDIIGSCDG